MKAHIIVKLEKPLGDIFLPHWLDFIDDKSSIVGKFGNELDRIFDEFNLRFWITKEYKPRNGTTFAPDETDSGLNKIYRVILRDGRDCSPALINKLQANPLVKNAYPIEISQTELPKISRASSVDFQTDHSRDQILLKQAQLYSKGNPQIKIAVLDTGVDVMHPELENVITHKMDLVNIRGLDTTSFIGDFTGIDNSPDDEVGHGTHVSGIIAAKGLKMPQGVVPECKLMAIRVLAALKQGDKVVGAGLIDNINNGIKWAVDNGADVINMSLGIKHEGGGLPHAEIIQYALQNGVTIVAASGNDGTADRYYPGALPGVIAVGAVDSTGNVTPFSTYGPHVTLLAPGDNIFSSYKNSTYAYSSGTSQASPFVTGGIALLKSYALTLGSRLSDSQFKYILKNTSDKINQKYKDVKGGYGALNLLDAVKLLKYSLT
jgi:thermitase